MAIFQHVYTSFFNAATNEGGFRTKAVSPGLAPELLTTVLRLISYRIPTTADERTPDAHPVALRYSVVGARDGVISRIRSCGADENGRPGNFLAHSLISQLSELGDVHPALLWEHPNWHSADPAAVAAIPPLPRLDWCAAIEDSEISAFLAAPDRQAIFPGLLTAIAASAQPTGRRVVIVDAPRNVAIWTAAVCGSLPSSLRPAVTFATYYHDPYQAPWLITGTTPDSTFRLGHQEFLQFFVIDAASGRTSEHAAGAHARSVGRFLAAREELRAYLAFCDRRMGRAPLLDGSLDRIAEAYEILSRSNWDDISVAQIELLAALVDGMASSGEEGDEHVSDLVFALSVARAALMTTDNLALLASYRRAAAVARRQDHVFEACVDEEVQIVAKNAPIAAGDAKGLLDDITKSYGEPVVRTAIDTALTLAPALGGGQAVETLTSIWECFGRLMLPDNGRSDALDVTLRTVDSAAGHSDQPLHPAAARLISVLMESCKGRERTLLGAALRWRREQGGASAELIYYTLVGGLPLDQRRPWRQIVEKEIDDIAIYEVHCDIRSAGDSAPSVLSQWAGHLTGDQRKRNSVIRAGVHLALRDASPSEHKRLSSDLLRHNVVLDCLESDSRDTLVRAAFAERSVEWILREPVEFIRRFVGDQALPMVDAALLEIRMAVDSRRFDDRVGAQVQHRLSRMADRAKYVKEAEVILRPFVSTTVRLEDYGAAMRAAYVPTHSVAFWQLHRSLVTKLCADLPTPPKIRLPFMRRQSDSADQAASGFAAWFAEWLDFWFAGSARGMFDGSYVSQQFFMELPGTLEELQECPAWSQVAPLIATKVQAAPWFSLVGPFFV